MGLGHISVAGHATSGGASRIQHHPPSKKSQSRLRSAQNTCGVTDWCESHSTHPDPRKRKDNNQVRSRLVICSWPTPGAIIFIII